jgi:VPDSG-CTERM motif
MIIGTAQRSNQDKKLENAKMKKAILYLAIAMLLGAASASAQTTTLTDASRKKKVPDGGTTLALLGITLTTVAVLRRHWRL